MGEKYKGKYSSSSNFKITFALKIQRECKTPQGTWKCPACPSLTCRGETKGFPNFLGQIPLATEVTMFLWQKLQVVTEMLDSKKSSII